MSCYLDIAIYLKNIKLKKDRSWKRQEIRYKEVFHGFSFLMTKPGWAMQILLLQANKEIIKRFLKLYKKYRKFTAQTKF